MPRNNNNKRITNAKKLQLCTRAKEIFSSLENINKQFKELKMENVESMEEAVDKILRMFLNIQDFVNGKLKIFKNKYALAKYTIRNDKRFPKKEAKESGLSHLLVKLSFWSCSDKENFDLISREQMRQHFVCCLFKLDLRKNSLNYLFEQKSTKILSIHNNKKYLSITFCYCQALIYQY